MRKIPTPSHIPIDKESPLYRQVQYELYHTDLGLCCPFCKEKYKHLSSLVEHMRTYHRKSYIPLLYMKKKACILFYKLCQDREEKLIIEDIKSEITKKLGNHIRRTKKNYSTPFKDVTEGYADMTIVNSTMVLNLYSIKVCIHLKPAQNPDVKIISAHFSDIDVLSLECSQKTTIGDVKSYLNENFYQLIMKNLLCASGKKIEEEKIYKPKNAHFITTSIESNRKRH